MEEDATPPRGSRQALVVPPRGARPFVAILGAAACAVAGFGLVWWTGLGRTASRQPTAAAPATPPAADASPFPPQPFQLASGATAAARALPSPTDAEPDGPWDGRRSGSAFGSRSSESDTARDAGSDVAQAAFESADDAGDDDDAEAHTTDHDGVDSDMQAPNPPEPSASNGTGDTRGDAPAAGAAGNAGGQTPPDAATITESPRPVRPPLSAFSVSGPPAGDGTAEAPKPLQAAAPAPPDPSAFNDPEAPVPVGAGMADPPPERRGPTPEPTGPSTVPAATALPSNALEDRAPATARGPERLASTDGARGFGMAPPLGPSPAAAAPLSDADPIPGAVGGPSTANLPPQTPGEAAPASARPGPLQLEGVQTPQVALEKRGPREVQVGKVARYETILRNVGAAIARDVTLHDAVPAGTKLVSTVPPAAPDARGGLVWQLGDLPQGGEARVAMELMPVEEGEVGSVASVAFRADASVRSLATRPDLRIEVQPPKPVLVGAAVDMSIVLNNPGTGEATGIVLEGILPEALAHAAGREVEFDVGRLRPGESRRIDLRLSSKLPGTHPLRLVARADAGIEVEEPLRITITAPTLELTADIPGRRYLQRPATCILSMANGGTAPARSVELAAQVPQGMKFVRANNAGTYDESTHRVIWHLEELPPGEVGSVELVLMPVALGPQRIAVAARALDGLSDQLVESIDVEGLAALAFQVSDSEDPVEVGGFTEYVVRVGNQGTKPASGVRVTVSLLGDLEPVEASGPVRYRVENLSIVFDPLASLAPDEESVFRVRARGRRAGDQRVQVQVTSTDTGTPITKEEVTRVYADD